jgi:hypothetical protein
MSKHYRFNEARISSRAGSHACDSGAWEPPPRKICDLLKLVVTLFILILPLSACSFGPPPSCGDNNGGTANTSKFDQFFTNMQLVNEASG